MAWLTECVLAVTVLMMCSAEECPQRKVMWSRAAYPDPMNMRDVDKCGRGGQMSHICDPDCIITISQANYLDMLIGRIENGTQCPCAKHYCTGEDNRGYRIGIALMLKMEKDANMLEFSGDTSLDSGRLFAYTLEQRWEWGQCSEDIVILYSLEDNVVYTVTGKETAKRLKPGMVGEISMNWRAYFGSSEYIYRGLEGMISDYRDVLMGNYTSGLNRAQVPRTAAVIGGSGGASAVFSVATLIIGLVAAILTFA